MPRIRFTSGISNHVRVKNRQKTEFHVNRNKIFCIQWVVGSMGNDHSALQWKYGTSLTKVIYSYCTNIIIHSTVFMDREPQLQVVLLLIIKDINCILRDCLVAHLAS